MRQEAQRSNHAPEAANHRSKAASPGSPPRRVATLAVLALAALANLAACAAQPVDEKHEQLKRDTAYYVGLVAGLALMSVAAVPITIGVILSSLPLVMHARKVDVIGRISLDDVYRTAYGVPVDSPEVDPATGQLLDRQRVPERTMQQARRDFDAIAAAHGIATTDYALCREVQRRDGRTYLLLSIMRRPGAPGNTQSTQPGSDDEYLPDPKRDAALDWVAIDAELLGSDRGYALLLVASLQSAVNGKPARDYWHVRSLWQQGRLAAVRARSEERSHRILAAQYPPSKPAASPSP